MRTASSSPARAGRRLLMSQLLEDEIGKPVVTSSLACSWYAMKLVDIKEHVKGFGRLMASLGN